MKKAGKQRRATNTNHKTIGLMADANWKQILIIIRLSNDHGPQPPPTRLFSFASCPPLRRNRSKACHRTRKEKKTYFHNESTFTLRLAECDPRVCVCLCVIPLLSITVTVMLRRAVVATFGTLPSKPSPTSKTSFRWFASEEFRKMDGAYTF